MFHFKRQTPETPHDRYISIACDVAIGKHFQPDGMFAGQSLEVDPLALDEILTRFNPDAKHDVELTVYDPTNKELDGLSGLHRLDRHNMHHVAIAFGQGTGKQRGLGRLLEILNIYPSGEERHDDVVSHENLEPLDATETLEESNLTIIHELLHAADREEVTISDAQDKYVANRQRALGKQIANNLFLCSESTAAYGGSLALIMGIRNRRLLVRTGAAVKAICFNILQATADYQRDVDITSPMESRAYQIEHQAADYPSVIFVNERR